MSVPVRYFFLPLLVVVYYGTFAETTTEPSYTVLLKSRTCNSENYVYFCLGAILSKKWVLTAAHCLRSLNFCKSHGLVAEISRRKYLVETIYTHPNFSETPQIVKSDLALLELKNPITFSVEVTSVPLCTINNEEVPLMAESLGFREESGDVHTAKYFTMKNLDLTICSKIHIRKNNLVDKKTQVCAIGLNEESFYGIGDATPLVKSESKCLVGIFSSLEDYTGKFPLLFMRVMGFLRWIKQITKLDYVSY